MLLCPGAAAGGCAAPHGASSHCFNALPTWQSRSWSPLKLGMPLNQPLARSITNIDAPCSKTGFPEEVFSLQLKVGIDFWVPPRMHGSAESQAGSNCWCDKTFPAFLMVFFASFSATKGEKGKQTWFKAWWPVAGCSALPQARTNFRLLMHSRLPGFLKSCFDSHEPDFRNTLWPCELHSPARSASEPQGWDGAASHVTSGVCWSHQGFRNQTPAGHRADLAQTLKDPL